MGVLGMSWVPMMTLNANLREPWPYLGCVVALLLLTVALFGWHPLKQMWADGVWTRSSVEKESVEAAGQNSLETEQGSVGEVAPEQDAAEDDGLDHI
mmetsp:Transcript_21727/g.49718  ORF Transcript_21727/g.49718 Transcript_21727/m.49718 type:complete len:97 (-) Transcript_21727:52-342(-)